MEELSDIHKRGNTIIMVTHNPSLTTYASRVITMLDGRIDTDTKDPRAPINQIDTTKRRLDSHSEPTKTEEKAKKVSKKSTKTKSKSTRKGTKK
ncbi:hypothetical protein A3C39_03130 [Candidatus Saccharibacteria bacterium RIFCSPHIGHO2_02_FULL_46_12]|nr:MAG: hypothetical protein A3C39_03130 [Candidatus Saccharibacteria bacterium RIFCSPHIGHO2_02_FULL_46_12]